MKASIKTILVWMILCTLVLSASSCTPPQDTDVPADTYPNDDLTVEKFVLPNNFYIRIEVSDGGEEFSMRTAKVGNDWQTITQLPGNRYEWRFYRPISENRYSAYKIQDETWVWQKTVNFSGLLQDSAAALTFLFDTSLLPEDAVPVQKTRTTGLYSYETLEYNFLSGNGSETIIELDKTHPNILLYYSSSGLVRIASDYNRSAGDWAFMHAANQGFFMPPEQTYAAAK